MSKKMTYNSYKENVLSQLKKALEKSLGRNIEPGKWKYSQNDDLGNKITKEIDKDHILPLEDSNKSAAKKRAAAMQKYLNIDVSNYLGSKLKGLHQYSHHLNSSQTLCIQFFSALIDGEYPHFTAKQELVELLKTIGISIHEGAECKFEYTEQDKDKYRFKIHNQERKEVNEYEGTSFDFHIKDNDVEVYFEIKFTEDGFGKANNDQRHEEKAEQYTKLLPPSIKPTPTVDELLTHYQLFRNIIRATDEKKYVVFITDANNPSTENEKTEFIAKFGEPNNVLFLTWQEIRENYSGELPFQFECFKK